jgi:outer membrane protein
MNPGAGKMQQSGWIRVATVLFGYASCALAADTLSLDSFVNIAKKQNPQVRISGAALSSSLASQKTARSRLMPQVNASAQAGRSMSQLSAPQGGNYYSSNYSAGISGQQLLFDFGKSYYSTRASSQNVNAAREDAKNALQTVVLNAKTAYFNYCLSKMLYDVAREALAQAAAHLSSATALYEIGKQAKYTVTQAEVDVANASVTVITAKNNVKLAKVQMDVAAGASLGDEPVLTDSLNAAEPDINREEAVSRALESRPELVSLRSRLQAAQLQLKSARTALYPDLNASAGMGYNSGDASAWRQDWNVGINLSIPIFEGGALVAAVDQAKAAVDQSSAQLDASVQGVTSEISQNYYSKMEAAERIIATQKLIREAAEGLQLAQERFAAGAASSLEVTDAEATAANAKSSHAQALFDYRVAHAKLLVAIGSP